MEAKDYQEAAKRTVSPLENFNANCYHMIFGLVTEVGELADLYKKYMAYGKEFEPVDIKNEMGDILWYLANLATLEGLDLTEVMEFNISKLKKAVSLQIRGRPSNQQKRAGRTRGNRRV